MNSAAESEIRQLIERWVQAVRDRDLEGIAAPYADDIVAFDAIQALQFADKASYRAHWEMCMGHCTGPMVFEVAQLSVQADGDLALAHWLNRCGPPMTRASAATCAPRSATGATAQPGR